MLDQSSSRESHRPCASISSVYSSCRSVSLPWDKKLSCVCPPMSVTHPLKGGGSPRAERYGWGTGAEKTPDLPVPNTEGFLSSPAVLFIEHILISWGLSGLPNPRAPKCGLNMCRDRNAVLNILIRAIENGIPTSDVRETRRNHKRGSKCLDLPRRYG